MQNSFAIVPMIPLLQYQAKMHYEKCTILASSYMGFGVLYHLCKHWSVGFQKRTVWALKENINNH